MAGAGVVGGMLQRVETAYAAGCDMLLVCNSPDSVAEVLSAWQPVIDKERVARVERLLPVGTAASLGILQGEKRYLSAVDRINSL